MHAAFLRETAMVLLSWLLRPASMDNGAADGRQVENPMDADAASKRMPSRLGWVWKAIPWQGATETLRAPSDIGPDEKCSRWLPPPQKNTGRSRRILCRSRQSYEFAAHLPGQ